jgi:competence protein ComEA
LILALPLASCGVGAGDSTANRQADQHKTAIETRPQYDLPRVNINTATAEELVRLPGIGEATSRRIIEHRERNGPFKRPEDLIIVEGFSERKYRALAGMICVE